MSDKLHLLIPGAAPQAGAPAVDWGRLPNLRALLAALAPADRIALDEDSLSTPFEVALARANGLPDEPGRIPWAAFETGTTGTPCAWIKPCHWRVGADHILLTPPQALALDKETSEELLRAMAPYFQEDGIELRSHGLLAGAWLGTGEPLRGLSTLSMDRAVHQRLTPSVFDAAGPVLRRLQNEMQMLLYTHPANDARQERGLLPVNSFWVAGAGVLERAVAPRAQVRVEPRLCDAQPGGPAAHAQAWREVDAGSCAMLLARLRAGAQVQLTLCGERAAQAWGPALAGAWARLKGSLGLRSAPDVVGQL
jgi:hypothetical protein